LKAIFRPVSELEPSDRAGDAADVAGSVRSAGTVALRCIRFARRAPLRALSPLRTRPRLSLAPQIAEPYPRLLRQTTRTRPAFSAQSSSFGSSWR